MNKIINIKK